MKSSNCCTTEQTEALLEMLDRLDSIDAVLNAIRCGHWAAEPEVLEAVGDLLNAALSWAVRAEAAA